MRKTAVLLALMAMSMSDVFAATGKIVTTDYVAGALESLDAAQVGASGSYIQYVSETNGIVSATAKAFDTSMSSTSTNAVQNKVVNTALGKKQDKLSTAQLNAVNSGITAAKVSTYDGYASGKQDTLVPDTNIKGSGSVTVTKGTDGVITVSGTDTVYTLPTATSSTLGGVKVDTALSSTSTNPVQNKVVNTAISNLQTAVNGKQATLTTTNVTTSGSGNVVTAVTASNGTVTVTKGTTLGSLATKSAVGSSDITDGSIANADIANGAVTAVKTTGIFGFIPSGSEGASATATIWVE